MTQRLQSLKKQHKIDRLDRSVLAIRTSRFSFTIAALEIILFMTDSRQIVAFNERGACIPALPKLVLLYLRAIQNP
jgi:hypothetical protein